MTCIISIVLLRTTSLSICEHSERTVKKRLNGNRQRDNGSLKTRFAYRAAFSSQNCRTILAAAARDGCFAGAAALVTNKLRSSGRTDGRTNGGRVLPSDPDCPAADGSAGTVFQTACGAREEGAGEGRACRPVSRRCWPASAGFTTPAVCNLPQKQPSSPGRPIDSVHACGVGLRVLKQYGMQCI